MKKKSRHPVDEFEEPSQKDVTSPRPSILVVDDTPANLRLISRMLVDHGYHVRVATDGERALASVKTTFPDLILLDIMLPGMSGYEVCERLKAEVDTQDIPVIFISALGTVDDKVRAFEVGGVDYINKPLQVREILARIDTHLSLHSLRKSLSQELAEKEALIAQLDDANSHLQHEIADRQQAETALELSRQHFRTVADFTYNWEYWMGLGGYPVYISPSCQRITGYRREEFQKDPGLMAAIVHPDDRDMWIQHLNTMMSSDTVNAFRFRVLARDGTVRWLGHACQPVYNKEGEFLGRRASNRDITEQVLAEEQREQYALDLESRNAELDAFAHTVAHDLKSPLTSLVGFSQLLGGRFGRMSPDQLAEGLGYIEQNARKMVNIVDELLLLASVREIENVDIAPLAMARIVAEARARLDTMFLESGAEIVIPGAWPEAVGYAAWIEEVWVNYISNAIKYGGRPDAGIPARIELGFDPVSSAQEPAQSTDSSVTSSSHIRFWVKDNGPGLSEQGCAQLFTQFTRLHTVRAKGHGLGLSIVRRIVEKLSGTVGVESELGVGSTFWFTLPRSVPEGDF